MVMPKIEVDMTKNVPVPSVSMMRRRIEALLPQDATARREKVWVQHKTLGRAWVFDTLERNAHDVYICALGDERRHLVSSRDLELVETAKPERRGWAKPEGSYPKGTWLRFRGGKPAPIVVYPSGWFSEDSSKWTEGYEVWTGCPTCDHADPHESTECSAAPTSRVKYEFITVDPKQSAIARDVTVDPEAIALKLRPYAPVSYVPMAECIASQEHLAKAMFVAANLEELKRKAEWRGDDETSVAGDPRRLREAIEIAWDDPAFKRSRDACEKSAEIVWKAQRCTR